MMHRPKCKIDQAPSSTLTLSPYCINSGHVTVVILPLVTAFYITGSLKRPLAWFNIITASLANTVKSLARQWHITGLVMAWKQVSVLSGFLAITSVTWPMAVTVLCINTYFKSQFTLLCPLTHFCIKTVLLLELALVHGTAHLLLGNSVLYNIRCIHTFVL